jgi:hypothetical protein
LSADRIVARLVTGPLGRIAAFCLDLGALFWHTLRNKVSSG